MFLFACNSTYFGYLNIRPGLHLAVAHSDIAGRLRACESYGVASYGLASDGIASCGCCVFVMSQHVHCHFLRGRKANSNDSGLVRFNSREAMRHMQTHNTHFGTAHVSLLSRGLRAVQVVHAAWRRGSPLAACSRAHHLRIYQIEARSLVCVIAPYGCHSYGCVSYGRFSCERVFLSRVPLHAHPAQHA